MSLQTTDIKLDSKANAIWFEGCWRFYWTRMDFEAMSQYILSNPELKKRVK